MTQATKTTRKTRASGTRKKTWSIAGKLDTPPAPDGVQYRWIRHELLGDNQNANVHGRSRQGYEIVTPEELGDEHSYDVLDTGKHAGTVRSGDLILMKIDQDVANQRKEYFQSLTDRQAKSAKKDFTSQDSAMAPVSQDGSSSTVTVGGQRSKANFED